MNPLNVLVSVKNSAPNFERETRNRGMFSYAVPEFQWDFIHWPKGSVIDRSSKQLKNYDFIFQDDGGGWVTYTGSGLPVVFFSFDSTLSYQHYQVRYEQAKTADLILLDYDNPDRFRFKGKRTLQFPHAVNDRLFYPAPVKTADLCYHCSTGSDKGNPDAEYRSKLKTYIGGMCKFNGWTLRAGALHHTDYARSMAVSKIAVNPPRTLTTRPHRMLDAMACKTAVLSFEVPLIAEDHMIPNIHYKLWRTRDDADLEKATRELLAGEWERYAEEGYNLVMSYHTWKTRAQQLRELVKKEFGL